MGKTLKDLKEQVDKILKEHPEWADLPLIYSSDDEGNSYEKVHNTLSPAQAEGLKNYSVEIVGFLGAPPVTEKDVNCICIN